MSARVLLLALLGALLPGPLAAQTRPATLSTLFEDVFGPNGLVVNSDDVQLDGTNHAAHFNSAFQSDFRLMNIALASQLTSLPVPSPASGFIYKFDSATGTFVRSTRSFGPILADRGETIGRGPDRVLVSTTSILVRSPGRRAAHGGAGCLPARRLSDRPRADRTSSRRMNTIDATVGQMTAALTYGLTDRFDISSRFRSCATRLSLLSNATDRSASEPARRLQVALLLDPSRARRAMAPRTSSSPRDSRPGSAISAVAREGDVDERRWPRAGGRRRRAVSERRRGKPARQRRAGLRPFVAFSGSFGRHRAARRTSPISGTAAACSAGDVRSGRKRDLPDQFVYAFGSGHQR